MVGYGHLLEQKDPGNMWKKLLRLTMEEPQNAQATSRRLSRSMYYLLGMRGHRVWRRGLQYVWKSKVVAWNMRSASNGYILFLEGAALPRRSSRHCEWSADSDKRFPGGSQESIDEQERVYRYTPQFLCSNVACQQKVHCNDPVASRSRR